MKLIKSFYFSFGTKILSLAILLISRILTARILNPSDFGSIGNALNFATIITRWGSMGIGPATQFTASKYSAQKNILLIYAILFSVFLGVSGLLIFFYFEVKILSWQFANDSNGRLVFLKFIPWLPIITLSMTLPILLLGLGRFRQYSFTQVLPLFFQAIVICIAYNRQNAFELVILAQIISWISTVVIAFLFTDYKNSGSKFDGELLSIYVQYALKAWPQVILQFGISRFAALIGNYYLTSQELGYYILASNLSESFLIFSTSITPIIFNRVASKGPDFSFLGRSLRFSNLVFIMLCPIITFLGKPIFIYTFGIDYAASWNLLLLLLISVMFQAMTRICLNYMAALGKNTLLSGIQFCQLIILFFSGFSFCPVFGVPGLCYAGIIASITGFTFCIFTIKKLEKKQNSELFSLFLFTREDIKVLSQIKLFYDKK